jgi:peptidoglycan LD-endopeptidase CwlK
MLQKGSSVIASESGTLIPEFREKVLKAISLCRKQGVVMRPFCTLRDPLAQARLWRQSRTIEEISLKITDLKNKGADFLAGCLDSVGPQNGKHVTNALPGLSWHQWGEAIDCMWVVDGSAEWSVYKKVDGINGYRHFAEIAAGLGLTPGGTWKGFKDWPHVQLRMESNPAKCMSIVRIDAEMKARFGS